MLIDVRNIWSLQFLKILPFIIFFNGRWIRKRKATVFVRDQTINYVRMALENNLQGRSFQLVLKFLPIGFWKQTPNQTRNFKPGFKDTDPDPGIQIRIWLWNFKTQSTNPDPVLIKMGPNPQHWTATLWLSKWDVWWPEFKRRIWFRATLGLLQGYIRGSLGLVQG